MAEYANPSCYGGVSEDHMGSFAIKQMELDQFLMRRVDGMLVDELFWAYKIFAKSDTELTDLFNAIENQFIVMIDQMDLQVAIEYLYEATKQKEGTNRVITAFINLIETRVATITSEYPLSSQTMLFFTLHLLGKHP